MSSRRLSRPYFPIPPSGYDQRYFTEVLRSFSVFLEQIQNPCKVMIAVFHLGHCFNTPELLEYHKSISHTFGAPQPLVRLAQ